MRFIRPARALVAIIAIAVALYGQSTIRAGSLGSSTLAVFAAAIALAVFASIGLPSLPLAKPNHSEFERLNAQHTIGWIAAWILMLVGVAQFLQNPGRENSSPTGWVVYGLSMAVFALTFVPFGALISRPEGAPSQARPAPKPKRRGEVVEAVTTIVLLIVVIAVALAVRLNAISDFPDGVWYDEGANGLVSLKMLEDPTYRPLYVAVTQLPAHFNFIIAFLVQSFGVSIGAVRLAPTVFGVAAVAFTFLLFRRWFNTPVAFFAAGMFAVMRYSLTLSRFGVNGHTNVAFIVISLYFLDRAVRGKRLWDFAAAGLMIGLGLNFYYAFRLYAVTLLGFVLVVVCIWLVMRLLKRAAGEVSIGRLARAWAVPSLALMFGALVAIAPIAQFAARSPEQFFERTSTVSIFEKRDEPDLGKALLSNLAKHVLMWNVRGDGNGRHNIPAEPMLDPIMGALAVLGFGYAVAHARRARNFLMVSLFAATLMGGILSVDFEAPQAYRSNGTMLSLVYFATLPIALVAETIRDTMERQNLRRIGYAAAAVGAGVLLLNIGQYNLDAFFNRHRNDSASWSVQAPGETFAGREMKRLANDYDLVVSSQFANHPSQVFEAPQAKNFKIFASNDLLVFGSSQTRGVAYLLDSALSSTYQLLKRYFPGAQFKELTPPNGGDPVAFSVAISAEDSQRLLGVDASLFPDDSFGGDPITSVSLPEFAADWGAAPPAEAKGRRFAAEFRTTLYVPQYGVYKLSVTGAPDARVFVDEFGMTDAGSALGRGNHSLRVRLPAASAGGKFELLWQGPSIPQPRAVPRSALLRAPVTNNGLLGAYYRSPDWSGAPAFTQVDPEISFYFHNLPLPRPYTVEWTGKVFAPRTGSYGFSTVSIDESFLAINGVELLANRQQGASVEGRIQLDQGWHDLRLRFSDHTGYTRAYLYWTPPGGSREIIPASRLLPPMGAYPGAAAMAELDARPVQTPNVVRTSRTGDTGGSSVDLFRIPPAAPDIVAAAPAAQPASPAAGMAEPASVPAAPAVPRIQLSSVATVGKQGSGDGDFLNPRAIRIGKDGRLFVVDTGNKRLQILDANGRFLRAIAGPDGEVFSEPIDVAIAPNGDVVVLDSDKSALSRFDQEGKFLGVIALTGASMYKQRGFAIDKDGNFYVANTGGGQIIKYSPAGQALMVIGERGSGVGKFSEPNSVAVDENGTIYALDAQGKHAVVFDSAGRYAFEFAMPQASAAVGPRIVAAKDGSLLVTATEPHAIQQFSRDGKLIAEFGGFGVALGQFRQPTGIDQQLDTIWVVETGNHRLQKLTLQK